MRQPAMVRQWWRSVGVVAVALTLVAYGLAFVVNGKVDGHVRTTEERHAENAAKQREVEAQLAAGPLPD